MKLRAAVTMSVGLILAMLVYSAWAWARLPAGTHLSVHWSVFSRPDGAAAKPVTLLQIPAIASVLAGVFSRSGPRCRAEARRGH